MDFNQNNASFKISGSPLPKITRRVLKTANTASPNYQIEPQVLLDSYIEKSVMFGGIIQNVPVELDTTNRTNVLRFIDKAKQEKTLSCKTAYEPDTIFSLSAQNIKLVKWNTTEDLILRIAVHEIASICYIHDDDHHIIAVKYGDLEKVSDFCNFVVLRCDSRSCSEELCSLVGQCFQLVYTEATVQYLDNKLREASNEMSTVSSANSGNSGGMIRQGGSTLSTPTHDRHKGLDHPDVSFLSQSRTRLDIDNVTLSSSSASRSLPRMQRRNSIQRVDSELSDSANKLLSDYMRVLHAKLNHEELKRFAMLLQAWRNNMSIHEFCERVLELYGPARKHLMIGLRPFIPEQDSEFFETYLERMDLHRIQQGKYKQMTGEAYEDEVQAGLQSYVN